VETKQYHVIPLHAKRHAGLLIWDIQTGRIELACVLLDDPDWFSGIEQTSVLTTRGEENVLLSRYTENKRYLMLDGDYYRVHPQDLEALPRVPIV
jgi:hypothetical protein